MGNGLLKNLLKKIKINESTISTLLGALVVIVIGVLIFNYFRSVGQPPEKQADLLPEETIEEEVKLVENEEGKLVPESLPATHKVAKGEDLWQIAEKHYGSGYNWVDIAQANDLKNPNILLADQELTIPKSAVIEPIADEPEAVETATEKTAGVQAISGTQYTVQKGDHLWGIAVRSYGDGYKWVEIARANNLENPSLIHPGNQLTLPR